MAKGKCKIDIYAPGGERVAYIDAYKQVPYFGSLQWQPAKVVIIDSASILAANEPTSKTKLDKFLGRR